MSSVKDPMNDKTWDGYDNTEYHLSINADKGTNPHGKPVSLEFYCSIGSEGFELYWGEYIADDDGWTYVTMRFDKDSPGTTRWLVSRDHLGAFTDSSYDPDDLLEIMINAHYLIVEVWPYMKPALIATFDVRKLKVALDRLKNKGQTIDFTKLDMYSAGLSAAVNCFLYRRSQRAMTRRPERGL